MDGLARRRGRVLWQCMRTESVTSHCNLATISVCSRHDLILPSPRSRCASQERFNIWAALLNLEKAHGDEESLQAMVGRALHGADPKKVYTRVASMHEQAKDYEVRRGTRLHIAVSICYALAPPLPLSHIGLFCPI